MSSNSPTDRPRRPRGQRWLARAAFLLAVIATFYAGFCLVEKWRGESAWRQYCEQALARGVKLTLAEQVPAPVPDELNYAAIPIFQDAFRQPTPPNPFDLPEVAGVKRPPLGAVNSGEPIDLAVWQKYFIDTKTLAAAGSSSGADVLLALEKYAPQFEQLRIAGARPESRFPVRYEDGVAAALPHLQLFPSVARLYALRLAAHLALADSAAAYEDFRSGLRLYTALQKEPTLIAGLVRVSTLSSVEGAVWNGLARRQWGSAELEKITDELSGIRLMDDYATGLGSERGFCNMIHDQLVQKGTGELASLIMMIDKPGSVPNARTAGALLALYPTGWLRLSQTRANRYFDEMLSRVAQEPPRIFPERPVPSWPGDLSKVSSFERVRYLLFLNLAPALSEVERTYAYHQSLLDETRLGCALDRHRLAHGSFPETLDVLVPALLPALPADVMTGEPFRFRREADGGYRLYSVAWDRKDDGGKIEAKTSAKQQPDWVWTIPGASAPSSRGPR